MYNSGKVIIGIIIFVLLALTPFIINMASSADERNIPDMKYPEGHEECIRETDYMRAYHMDILNDWRDQVVRENIRYFNYNGEKLEMSLTNTCMDCHDNKADFCDQCHNYLDVDPYCWDCHFEQVPVEEISEPEPIEIIEGATPQAEQHMIEDQEGNIPEETVAPNNEEHQEESKEIDQ